MENSSEYFKAKRRVCLPSINRKIIKEMEVEELNEFLRTQEIYWHGSVVDKKGELFQPKTVGEIKKGTKLDLTISKQGLRTMFDVDFGVNHFVISTYDKGFMLNLSDKWGKFLEEYVIIKHLLWNYNKDRS